MKWKTPHIGRRAFIVLGLLIIPLVAGPVFNAGAELFDSKARIPENLISPKEIIREISNLAVKIVKDIIDRYRN